MKHNLVYRLFEKCAEQYPGKIAISDARNDSSYASLNDQANYIARLLNAVGVGRGKIVSYVGHSGASLVASLLGIFKTGGIYMPVDVALPAKRVRGMLEETGCRIVIIPGALKNDFLQWQTEWELEIEYLLVVEEGQLESVELLKNNNGVLQAIPVPIDKRKGNPNYDTSENDPAYIFYTSGSTGSGKPILGLQKGLVHFINWETGEFAVDEKVRVSQLTKITFDASLRDIFLPLTNGGTLCIPGEETRSNTVRLLEWLEEINVNMVHTVPSLFRLISKEIRSEKNTFSLPSLKHILMAGEPLYVKDITSWRESAAGHVELVNLYGTSETTMAKTVHRIAEVPGDPGQLIHAGKPIAGAFVAIVNNNGELCRIGEIGEIYIKTPYRTKGYYRHAELTATYFVQNPLNKEEEDIVHKTGDMGRYLADRSIEVLGRSDDQVKINGTRIQLSEIEQSLLGCEGIDEAVVIVHKGANQENELVGYYTGNAAKETVYQYLATNLGESMVPGHLMQLAEFPLSPNGKINKKELPRPDKQVVAADDYEPALPGVEAELETLWKELLGLTRIGRRVSFFEIGGNSLKAIQLISKIYKEYQVLVKINEIFACATIEKLGAHIQQAIQPVVKAIPALPAQNTYALSHAQKRLWVINQTDTNKVSYNVPTAFEIKGNLDVNILAQTIGELVKRHEILRTTFVSLDGEPGQQIAPTLQGELLEYIDLRGKATKAGIQDWIAESSHTVFDLEKGPLFKTALLHTNEQEYIYVVIMHHIICDAWSIEILNKEMLTLYDALTKGTSKIFTPLSIQYKEFAAWQNAAISGGAYKEHKKYWLQHLAGKLPRLDLPLDYPRPAQKKYSGKTTAFHIEGEAKDQLQAIAKQYDVSPFMLTLAILNILLHKHSGQDDIILGSPVAGREHPDLENQVGLYINTILLRNQVKKEEGLAELLAQVKRNTVKALTYQGYPFDILLDQLGFEPDRSRNVLFDIGFTYINDNIFQESGPGAFDELEVKEVDHELHDVKADIWFKVIETSSKFIFTITYSTDLFKPAFIERLSEDIRFLVSLVNKNEGLSIAAITAASNKHLEQWDRQNKTSLRNTNSAKLKALQLQK